MRFHPLVGLSCINLSHERLTSSADKVFPSPRGVELHKPPPRAGTRSPGSRGASFRPLAELSCINPEGGLVDYGEMIFLFPSPRGVELIISVGYRVKFTRGVQFRKWANSILKQYIIQGYAVNTSRMNQLGEVIRIMKRTENSLDAKQVLSVIEKYSLALDLLDDYDHQTMKRPDGNKAVYILSYEECRPDKSLTV